MNESDLTISADDVKEFKEVFCDENSLIKEILKKDFLEDLKGNIIDVGGGTGDVLSEVVPDEVVIHLDVLDFSSKVIPEKHTRIQGDFLDNNLMDTLKPIDMLFMSHVQQFIDSDLNKLNGAIKNAQAKNIILVEDMNDDFLGEVMRFSVSNFENANPEIKIDGFPEGYKKTKSTPLTANLECGDFRTLARQCLYLMDVVVSEENIKTMQTFLESKLTEPKFTINQEVNLYQI
jgi:hypothetical protein